MHRKPVWSRIPADIRAVAENTAPTLTPPGTTPTGGAGRSRPNLWLWLGSLFLLLLALAVILILPSLVPPSKNPVPTAEISGQQGESARSRLLHEKGVAESELEKLLRRRAELESQAVVDWGGTEYEASLQGAARADEELAAGRFAEAAAGYRAALQALERLDQSRGERFLLAMAAGRQALEQHDANGAERHFRIALALQPDENEAQQGLSRSVTIEQVVALTREGEERERQGQWDAAIGYYRQAVELDALYQPARDSLDRTLSLKQEQDFRAAMSSLLDALDRKHYGAADRALGLAGNLRPGAPELRDARQRLEAGRKRSRLFELRSGAQAAAAREDWMEASQLYAKALKLDPGAGFARNGLETAQKRLELQRELDRYIQQPERLQSDQPLANARALLKHLEQVADPGPHLQAKTEQLARLVAAAESKVAVRIHSDAVTDIVIYRVGRFGQFLQREVELRPGTYTLVGSREGYRDVRKTLKVQPGPGVDVVVRCEERI